MNTHSFSVELATELGIEKAIILQHIWFWHQKNKANEQNYHDGSFWTYNTAKSFSEMFPYIKEKKMYSILKSLEDDGFIKTGNYNKVKFDRTKWYALTEKSISIFKNGEMHFPKSENGISKTGNGISKSGEPIPDINTDNKPNINTDNKTEIPKNEFSGDDDSEPIIETKKKKNSAAKKKKKTDPLFQPFRKLFEDEYTRLTGTVYYWQVKDSVAINRLIQKVRYAYKTAKKPVENPTSEQMTNGFAHILKRAANDKWLSRNFETTLIDSKFNNLKNLRNGTQTEKDRELFQGVIDGYLNKD